MGFIARLFRKPEAESILLIDVGAGSVAGAYAHFTPGAQPTLAYTRRIPISAKPHEDTIEAMTRTLGELCDALVSDGAPALARLAGSGRVEALLVSISAPWQSTLLRHETFENARPFTFTRKMLDDAIRKATVAPQGKLLVDESVVGTTLNGYETREPFGKQVLRAQVLMLVSFIDEPVARAIAGVLRSVFHTERIPTIAGSSLRYQAVRSVFPHERNAFLLDASGPEIAISLIRKGLLVAVKELPDGEAGSPEWIAEVGDSFGAFATKYPLPRIIFILADDDRLSVVQRALEGADLGKMWLTDEPPKVVPIRLKQLPPVKQGPEGEPDIVMQLMTLYWREHGHDE